MIPYVLTKPSALQRFWLATLLQEPVCYQRIKSHVCHIHGDHLSTMASSHVNTKRHVSWLIPGTLDLFVATCKQWPLTMQDHFTLWLCKKAEAFEITDHFYVSRHLDHPKRVPGTGVHFNKDTFEAQLPPKCIYIPWREQWALEATISTAKFLRPPATVNLILRSWVSTSPTRAPPNAAFVSTCSWRCGLPSSQRIFMCWQDTSTEGGHTPT